MAGNDGVKRYLTELLKAFMTFDRHANLIFEIDLYVQGKAPFSLSDHITELADKIASIKENPPVEIKLLQIKKSIRSVLPDLVYRLFKRIYASLPIRYFLRNLNIKLAKKDAKKLKKEFEKYDLIHVPLPQNFHYLNEVDGKFLVTIHDLSHLLYPEFHTQDNIRRSSKGIDLIFKKKARLLAVSEATKKDILKFYPVGPEEIHTVYESFDEDLFFPKKVHALLRKVLSKYNLPYCRYFLSLSTLEPRKNISNMLKAFDLFSKKVDEKVGFFVCGKTGWKMNDLKSQQFASNKNVFFTGFISDEDLSILYSHALALCYVSFYEGFGLPPVEAMACGTTVIYGDSSAMPEVIGNAGLPANPDNVVDIKNQMEKIFNDKALRTSLCQKALERASLFSRKKMAIDTLKLYQDLIEGHLQPKNRAGS
ncbi:MAG: glycosyltransferase family 1 protein [Bacteroidota bacterium]